MKTLWVCVVLAIGLGMSVSGQTASITGPVTFSNGQPYTGIISISPIGIWNQNATAIIGGVVTCAFAGGQPTSGCALVPGGAYRASYGNGQTETWTVSSAVSYTVAAIRSPQPPSPSMFVSSNQITAPSTNGLCLVSGNGVASWQSCSGGASVSSFNGRSNAVTPQAGDYTTSLVAEGTNQYFTAGRVLAAMSGLYQSPITGAPSTWPTFASVAISGSYLDLTNRPSIPSSTTSISEGTNLYFTSARVLSAMSGLYQTPISGAPGTWPTIPSVSSTGNVLKGNGSGSAIAAAAADVVGLFGGVGAGTKYLGDDGALHTASSGGVVTTSVIDLGPLCMINGYTYGVSTLNWSGASLSYTGGNVPVSAGGYYDCSYQWANSNNYVVMRLLWIPPDYDSTQAVTVGLSFGPDSSGATGNVGMKAAIGCATSGTTTFGSGATPITLNSYSSTGAVTVSGTQYTVQNATTATLNMTGCSPGALARLTVGRDNSVATNSAVTLDVIAIKFTYSRK